MLFKTEKTSVLTCSRYSVYGQKNVKCVPLFGILLKINLNTMKLINKKKKNKKIGGKENKKKY